MQADKLVQQAAQAHQQGRLGEAERLYRKVLKQVPRHPEILMQLGIVLFAQGQRQEALHHLHWAVQLAPASADAANNLGLALRQCGQPLEAFGHLQRAVQLDPHHALAYNNLGGVLFDMARTAEAVTCFQRAITLQPRYLKAHTNLGCALNRQGDLYNAIEVHRRLLQLAPNYPEAHNNLGCIYKDAGLNTQALAHFRQALALQPQYPDAYSNMLLTLHYLPGHGRAALHEIHAGYARLFPACPRPSRVGSHERLRVGYVSADFRRHSVAYFMEALLRHHARDQFEIFCFYNQTLHDAVTARFRDYAEHWRECAGFTDAELGAQIGRDQIDILVDLSGHTEKNRLPVFAARPAPVQISYLGYPDSTGLACIDYRLTDAWADPRESDGYSAEQPLRLPHTYFCYTPPPESPEVGPPPANDNGYVTFGSFNNLAKLNSATVQLWAEVLRAVPDARLLLKNRSLADTHVRQEVLKHFTNLGIAPERLILKGFAESTQGHLGIYRDVDIALDCFPYNGATTTCEALWMGVPVVSLAGEIHAGRMGLSILHGGLNLPQLVAHAPDDYVRLCAKLAGNWEDLANLRAGLRQRMQNSPLMDGAGFSRTVEALYRDAWAAHAG